MDHIGIDVHKTESQICILCAGSELIERRVRTTPERFADVLGDRPRARILLEASTESEWVARCLEQLGHEVIGVLPSGLGGEGPGHFQNHVHCRQCMVHSLVCSASKFLILRADQRIRFPIGDPSHGGQCTPLNHRFSRVYDRRSSISSF